MPSTNTEFQFGSWVIYDYLFVFQYISILCLIMGTETSCIIYDTLLHFNFLVPEHLSMWSDAVGLHCRVQTWLPEQYDWTFISLCERIDWAFLCMGLLCFYYVTIAILAYSHWSCRMHQLASFVHIILLLINSQHISAQIGHDHVILEEYTNDDEIHVNYNANIKFFLVKLGWIWLNVSIILSRIWLITDY